MFDVNVKIEFISTELINNMSFAVINQMSALSVLGIGMYLVKNLISFFFG